MPAQTDIHISKHAAPGEDSGRDVTAARDKVISLDGSRLHVRGGGHFGVIWSGLRHLLCISNSRHLTVVLVVYIFNLI